VTPTPPNQKAAPFGTALSLSRRVIANSRFNVLFQALSNIGREAQVTLRIVLRMPATKEPPR